MESCARCHGAEGTAPVSALVPRLEGLSEPYIARTLAEYRNRYGLYNQDDPRGRAIPHPTTYVIDMDGVVRWKFTEVDYRIRPENADILAALEEVGT